jgi:integrase
MANASFFLKNPNDSKQTLIYLIFQFGYYEINNGNKKFKFLKYSTGEKIEPKFWNFNLKRAKASEKFPEHSELNTRLEQIAAITRDVYRHFLNDGIKPNPELMRNKLNERLGKFQVEATNPINLIEFIRQLIEESKSGQRVTSDGKKLSNFTVKGYRTTLNHILKFQEIKNVKLDFASIDLDFYDDFVNYFTRNNYAINSIGKHIKNLKVFLQAAVDKRIFDGHEFQNKRFRTIEEKTDSIYLSDIEILKIYQLDLSKSLQLEKTRDLFVVGCYTGLRFSDYKQIIMENIKKSDNGAFLHIKTHKTGELVVIPMNWVVQELLSKYDDYLPKIYVNQVMNRGLKDIGKLADINEKVSHSITKGGIRIDTIYSKFELITTHTARRSFATNAYLANIPTISIMKITGHKTEKAFMRYIKISQEDNANKLAEHPYFSQQKPVGLKVV